MFVNPARATGRELNNVSRIVGGAAMAIVGLVVMFVAYQMPATQSSAPLWLSIGGGALTGLGAIIMMRR